MIATDTLQQPTATLAALQMARKDRLARIAAAGAMQSRKLEQRQYNRNVATQIKLLESALPNVTKRREYETRGRPSSFMPIAQRILRAVAQEFDMLVSDLVGPLRTSRFVAARFVTVCLLTEMTNMSLPSIGRRLGNRDHTTILHARHQVAKLLAGEAFRNRVDQIKAGISK